MAKTEQNQYLNAYAVKSEDGAKNQSLKQENYFSGEDFPRP